MSDCRAACPIPDGGYCARHALWKSPNWVRLCRARENYYQAWETGRGPGQFTGAPPLPRPPPGPGTVLRRLLGCHGFPLRKAMDAWGLNECAAHSAEIIACLTDRESMTDEAARRLLAIALNRARQYAAAPATCHSGGSGGVPS